MQILSEEKFDWIFFDLGGVLIDESLAMKIRKEADLKIIKSYGISITSQELENEWRGEASRRIGDLDKNIFSIFLKDDLLVSEAIQKLKEEKGSWPSHEQRNFVKPEAKDVLMRLSKDFKLGIIANQPSFIRQMLQDAKIIDYFSFLGLSDEFHLHKPDPEFFEKVLESTGADPARSVFIDDNIERGLLPAKKFGFVTVWLNEVNLKRKDLSGIDYQISSLGDLISQKLI